MMLSLKAPWSGPIAALLLLILTAPAIAVPPPAPEPPAPLLDAQVLVPGLRLDMRYAGPDNFTGRPVPGYEADLCLLSKPAAEALARAQASLAPKGLGLKVFDCYRPARSVASFMAWARDPEDQLMASRHYPRVPKAELFAKGYIAERSGHSRGSTVDVTLVHLSDGSELDMGGIFDFFDPTAASMSPDVEADARSRRLLLRATMEDAGFAPYEPEWWHFTLRDEPFPDRYFDAPVREPSR